MTTPAFDKETPSLARKDLRVLAGFFIFLLLFFSDVLTQPGHICLGRAEGDARSQFYGWRAYGFGQIAQGRFPLWNPYEFVGMPFVASLQSSMFYPTNWLCAFLPLGLAINLGIIINLFLSGLFAYLWCRRIGLRWPGAMVAAAAYVFGAPQLLRIYEGHWSFLCSMPWIPAVLLCAEVFISGRRRMLALAGGAAAVAMQLFGGNPQYAFYGGIAAALYLAGRAWQERAAGKKRLLAAVGCFAGMYALGVLLAGVQFFPALELLAHSARQGQLSYDWVAQYSFAPENVATFLVPDLFGSDVGVTYWGRWNLWEMCPYVGVVAAGLAIASAFGGRRRTVLLAAIISAALLLLALGGYTPLLRLLYHGVPGFGLFRVVARFLCPLSLFLGLLAGLGADWLVSRSDGNGEVRPSRVRITLCIVGGLALALAVAGLVLTPADDAPNSGWRSFVQTMVSQGQRLPVYLPKEISPSESTVPAGFALRSQGEASVSLIRSGVLLGVLVVLLLLAMRLRLRRGWIAAGILILVAADVWTFGRRYLKTFDPNEGGLTKDAAAFLKKDAQPFRFARWRSYGLPAWQGMANEMSCIEGVQPNAPALFRDVFWSFQGFRRTTQKTSYSLRPPGRPGRIERFVRPFRMLNLRYLIEERRNGVWDDVGGLVIAYEDERVRIYELPHHWPRAWLVHEYVVEREPLKMLESLMRSNRYQTAAFFADEPGFRVQAPSADERKPHIVAYEPDRVVVEVEAAAPAFLILSDLYYPGWHAAVDGQRAPLLKANYLMRAVPVPAGRHVVEFTYAPFSFRAGVAASLFACAVMGTLVWLHCFTGRRKQDGDHAATAE